METAPTVSMLWESVDPDKRLSERFGFSSAASAGEWVADALVREWRIRVDRCDRLVLSAFNVMAWVSAEDRVLIAKWSAFPPLFARLADVAHLTTWLESRGIPVAAPIPAADGRLLIEVPNEAKGRVKSRLPLPGSRFLLGVMPVLEGDLLDTDQPAQVSDAGRMLAIMHEALAAYPHRFKGRAGSQEQLVHNDFRSANILHDGTRITAVLDLEEVKYDTRVADVAKATVFLGTRYRDWGSVTKAVRQAFVASYNDYAPLTNAEFRELDERIDAELRMKGWA